jgi:AbrB family looped-hinge helix DNA binding protein
MRARVSARGRVTVPRELRARLGIQAGTVLDFESHDGALVARVAGTTDAVDKAWGMLALDEAPDTFISRLRGRAPHEPM